MPLPGFIVGVEGHTPSRYGSVTLYVLLSCVGCDAVYTSVGGGGDPGSVDVYAQHLQRWTQTVLQIFYPVVHQKSVLYADSILKPKC